MSVEDKVLEKYKNNITEFSKKEIDSVLLPKDVESLRDMVIHAHENNVDLYTISTGKNWGLGSKQPVNNGSTVLHLKEMNNIIAVNEEFNYAIIEPGVTQKQLSDYLLAYHPSFKFPVTGSAEGTSVIGNLLERGAAFFGHKNQKNVAMEVLLADGKLLRTGFWHYSIANDPLAFYYPYGHGPDLRGLFTQSNFGIVTKMVVRLVPRLEGTIVMLTFKEPSLKKVTNLLRRQHEEKLLDDGIIITNFNDPRTARSKDFSYQGDWVAFVAFSGSKQLVKAKKKNLRKQYRDCSMDMFFLPTTNKSTFSFNKSTFFPNVINYLNNTSWFKNSSLSKYQFKSGDTLASIAQRVKTLQDYFQGIPSNYSIQTMAKMNNTILEDEDMDNANVLGFSVVLPAVPINGDDVLIINRLINEVSDEWDVTPFNNLASVDELTFEGFVRVYFDRKDQGAIKKAHGWSKRVHQVLRDNGYYPYRMDNERMKDFVDTSDVYWETIQKIKYALDENNILARGKYNF